MLPSDKQLAKCDDIHKLPLVRVLWVDTCSAGTWASLDEYRKKGALNTQSVGFLTRNDKTCVQVVQSISTNDSLNDSITIPRGCVVKVSVFQHPANKRKPKHAVSTAKPKHRP